MANWLERAQREIPQSPGGATAIADERNLTAVTAVPPSGSPEISRALSAVMAVRASGEPEISRASIGSNGSASAAGFREIAAANKATERMTPDEELSIREWLTYIEETDPAIIADLLDKCRTDSDARCYFIGRAVEVRRPVAVDDDRRRSG